VTGATSLRATRLPPRPLKWLLLAALFCLGAFYLAYEIPEAAMRDRGGEPALRTGVLVVHLVSAIPLLLLPPLQFSRRLRARWPVWHRRAGMAYLVSAVLASTNAIYLAVTFDAPGNRPPLLMFSLLWLAFSIAAWWCARRRAFAAHERFVVRSYAIALAFVFVRVLGEWDEVVLGFVQTREVRDATMDWLSFVVPLIVIEGWYTWWPSVPAAQR
jgi:uncharacterized membrane protein